MSLIQILKNSRTGPFRVLVAPVYGLLVSMQLVYERVLDVILCRSCNDAELDQLTALIKTFERPKKLKGLVRSIRRRYPELKIVVVDDSREPRLLKGVETLVLPYDSGVSAGRNAGLKEIQTPYMLSLDDDFVFNRNTDLLKALKDIKASPQIDILAGEVIYLPLRIVHDYSRTPVFPTSASPLHAPGTVIGDFLVHLKVPNFYLARTERIRLVGWDDKLKRLDHADFFTRAVGVLTAVQNPAFKVLHYPTYFSKHYLAKRNDIAHDQMVLHHKYRRQAPVENSLS